MMRTAKIVVFAGLFLWALMSLDELWRLGRSEAIADLGIAALLIGLMRKNPDRWVYAVAAFALLALSTVAAVAAMGVLVPTQSSLPLLLELLGTAVATAATLCLIVEQRRRAGEAAIARVGYGKLLLSALLILTVGILSQVTWRTWHAVYLSPMAMVAEGTPPRWQMWVVDVSLDWQLNYGLWKFLLGVALILVVGAQVDSRFSGARLYLAFYLTGIVAVSAGYLAIIN